MLCCQYVRVLFAGGSSGGYDYGKSDRQTTHTHTQQSEEVNLQSEIRTTTHFTSLHSHSFVGFSSSSGIVSAGPPMNFGERDPNGGGAFSGCIAGNERELNGAGLWLFTKDPEPEAQVVEMLRNKTNELGFDLSILEPVEHKGCTYPSI